MASTVVSVHPLVLLSIADDVTRLHLAHKDRLSAGSHPHQPNHPVFLSMAGLLMGAPAATATAGGGGRGSGTTTTASLTTSFELPRRLSESGEAVAPQQLSGDAAFAAAMLREEVDWAAARQHRELLDAVMPESSVMGCYVVCSGVRPARHGREGDGLQQASAKKPRNETDACVRDVQKESGGNKEEGKGVGAAAAAGATAPALDGLQRIAETLSDALQTAQLLGPPSSTTTATAASTASRSDDGWVLLVVYDGEITSHARTTAPSPMLLPCDALWVRVADGGLTDASRVTVRHAACAVLPADMEWIGLATEVVAAAPTTPPPASTHSTSPTAASPGAGGGAPQPATADVSEKKPRGFLRRCSAAFMSRSASSTNVAGAAAEGAGEASTGSAANAASAQSRAAAAGLLCSLRSLTRVVDAASRDERTTLDEGTASTPETLPVSAELLRCAATCVRNVPSLSLDTTTSTAAHSSNNTSVNEKMMSDAVASRVAESEADLLRAVLARAAQCAMRLADLQGEQRSIVHARVSAASDVGRRATHKTPSASLTYAMDGGRGAVSGNRAERSRVAMSMRVRGRAGLADGREEEEEEDEGQEGSAGGRWFPSRMDGYGRDTQVLQMKGYVWPKAEA